LQAGLWERGAVAKAGLGSTTSSMQYEKPCGSLPLDFFLQYISEPVSAVHRTTRVWFMESIPVKSNIPFTQFFLLWTPCY
jgi:hypothetical protein